MIERLVLRFSSSSLWGMRNIRMNSTARKMTFPLIKALHPDMFATESPDVQSTNIQCIQNLNSLWDCVDVLLQEMNEAKQQKRTTMDVKTAFRPEYNLDCYYRSSGTTEDSNSDQSLVRHSIKIIAPDVFRSKCTLSVDRAQQEINRVLIQHGDCFLKLGLKDPWSSLRQRPKSSSEAENDEDGDTMTDKQEQAQLETMMFERLQRANMYGGGGGGFSFASPVYKPRSTKGQHHPKGISLKERGEHRVERELLEQNLDLWIKKGNVLLQGLKQDEEVPAVKSLREFVLNYNSVLNFNLHFWSALMVVIEPPRAAPKPQGPAPRVFASKYSTSASKGPTVPPTPTSTSSELSIHAYTKHGFSHTVIEDARVPVYVLRIPSNFNEARLLDYLTENIPMASWMRDMPNAEKATDSVVQRAARKVGVRARRVF